MVVVVVRKQSVVVQLFVSVDLILVGPSSPLPQRNCQRPVLPFPVSLETASNSSYGVSACQCAPQSCSLTFPIDLARTRTLQSKSLRQRVTLRPPNFLPKGRILLPTILFPRERKLLHIHQIFHLLQWFLLLLRRTIPLLRTLLLRILLPQSHLPQRLLHQSLARRDCRVLHLPIALLMNLLPPGDWISCQS